MRGLNQQYLDEVLAWAIRGHWKDEDGAFSTELINGEVHIKLEAVRPLTIDERENAECVVTEILAMLHSDVPWYFDITTRS